MGYSMTPQICIASANGSLGREIVIRLAIIGEEIRAAMFESTSVDPAIDNPLVQTVAIDFTKPASIKEALSGIKKLIILIPCVPQMDQYVANLIECAKKSAVEHIIFISFWGVGNEPLTTIAYWYKAAEFKIVDSPLSYTIIRANFFMQRLIEHIAPKKNVISLPFADATVSFIDERDVAVAISEVTLSSGRYSKRIYELTGQEALSMNQVSEIFSETTGEKISYLNVEPQLVLNSSFFKKTDSFLIDPLFTYFNYLRSGHASKVSVTYEQITGSLPVSVLDFARDYADTLREKLKGTTPEAFNPQLWFT
jgi:uncharacterized protein YbjT (DUF2867 family)